jgi:hypothetical protein
MVCRQQQARIRADEIGRELHLLLRSQSSHIMTSRES